ncbi:MAG: class A beta-lactamase [Alphaproteobacteria bacterium]|nr:class A beta-lactamase [Alphaproteobacteria bacterium]
MVRFSCLASLVQTRRAALRAGYGIALGGLSLGALGAFAACSGAPVDAAGETSQAAEARLADIEARLGGRVGVHVIDVASGRAFGRRADERFAMCSTFKWLAALFALREAPDRDAVVPYTMDDLVPYAPVTKPALDGARALSLRDLAEAAVVLSDNPAANLLLRGLGGPEGFTARLRVAGDDATRLDRWEVDLNENLDGDPRDTTTPAAMAALVRKLLFEAPSAATPEAETVRDWMIASPTGARRVRGGLPEGWRVGDKTGTSNNGATNVVGFAYPPAASAPVIFAAYLDPRGAAIADAEAAHREIGAILAARFGEWSVDGSAL